MSDEVDCGQIRLILLPDYWQSDPVCQILENSYSAGLIQEFVWTIYILYRDLTIYSDKSTNSDSGYNMLDDPGSTSDWLEIWAKEGKVVPGIDV